jgi:hypothetical protein
MRSSRASLLIILVLALAPALASCDAQVRGQFDIRTNGFINDNCFQSLVVFEPDESARGLVARREDSAQKAKKADIREMALECLVNFSIEFQQKNGVIDKNKKDFNLGGHRARLADRLRGLTRGGRTQFSYYNDSNALVVGYTIYNIGFKKKLEEMLKTPDVIRQEGSTTEQRS